MFGPGQLPSRVQSPTPPFDPSAYQPSGPSGRASPLCGQLADGTTIALAHAGQTEAASSLIAQVLDTSAAAAEALLPTPAAVSPLEQVKSSPEFAELLGRLDQHTARIRQNAQYGAFTHGDRYRGYRPDERTAWPGPRPAWGEGTVLNGSYIRVGGQQIAIAAQYPLPDTNLFAFLQQLLADKIRTVVVLASDEEIADPKQKLPDYFRASAARADLHLPPEAGFTAPNEPDVLGSYVAGGFFTGGSQLVVVRSVEPMQPLAMAGLGNIRRAVIKVSSGSAHPFRPMPARSQVLTVMHLHNVAQNGVPTLEELQWLGGVVRAERRNGRLALVHCNSGTGRTGLLLAASVLSDPSSTASVETVVSDIRESRNWHAVGAQDQLAAAVLVARAHGKPVLAPDAPMP